MGTFNAEEKRAKLLAAVDSFTLSGVRKQDGLALTLRMEGAGPDGVKGTVEELNADMQWLQQVMPQIPTLAPIARAVGSVHAAHGGGGAGRDGWKEATVTAEVKSDVPAAVLVNVLPMLDLKPPEPPQQPGQAPNPPVVVPGQ